MTDDGEAASGPSDWELTRLVDEVSRYGHDHPDHFGGVYVERSSVIALFIPPLEPHVRALRQTDDSGLLTFREAAVSFRYAESRAQLVRLWLRGRPDSHVVDVGVRLRAGRPEVEVSYDANEPPQLTPEQSSKVAGVPVVFRRLRGQPRRY